jgi:hypothetical protein
MQELRLVVYFISRGLGTKHLQIGYWMLVTPNIAKIFKDTHVCTENFFTSRTSSAT